MIPRFRPTVSFWNAMRFAASAAFCGADNNETVKAFEDAFAKYHGAAGAVFVASGRMALRLILKALDYPAGSGIVVPAFTHFSIPAVIKAMGLKPLFADITPDTFEISADTVQTALAPGARAVIPTHLFGRTCPMPDLLKLAEKEGLDVIEDCAQAFGASTDAGWAGTLGKAAYFTFGVTKNFTTYSGGMALTNDSALLERIRALTTDFGPPCKLRLLKEGVVAAAMNVAAWPPAFTVGLSPILRLGDQSKPDLIHSLFDEPVRVTPEHAMAAWQWLPGRAQAAAGLRQLKALDANNQARRHTGSALLDALENLACCGLPARAEPGGDHLYMSFALRRQNRFRFISNLRAFGIDSSPGYVSNCCRFHELGGIGSDQCQTAEAVAREIVHLPMYPELGPRRLELIARAVARADAQSDA